MIFINFKVYRYFLIKKPMPFETENPFQTASLYDQFNLQHSRH
ncbi:hypothetical protein NEICINOT_04118 [Neisseria cinerea ATCC 14685]|uniref:Uncharacterized protein n=1 Tax=Neisseria cinerea ATCC 14685 TaxID=546262 RepID=D0W382_NEICI|nr:hypothetical protein NEICINOT_04118 [Neisseria cinerea ATCC 14685]